MDHIQSASATPESIAGYFAAYMSIVGDNGESFLLIGSLPWMRQGSCWVLIGRGDALLTGNNCKLPRTPAETMTQLHMYQLLYIRSWKACGGPGHLSWEEIDEELGCQKSQFFCVSILITILEFFYFFVNPIYHAEITIYVTCFIG